MRPALVALLLLALLPLAAAREATRTVEVGPGAIAEIEVVLDAPGPLGWRWAVQGDAAEVAFDVHVHDERGVRTLREATGTQHSGEVAAPAGRVFLAWSLADDAAGSARVDATVVGEWRFPDEEAAPAETPKAAPAAPLAALALAVGVAARIRRGE